MQYFITEKERKQRRCTTFFEFQRGKFRHKFWMQDSLYLHMDLFDRLFPYETVVSALPHFEYTGITEVTPKQYIEFKKCALNCSGETIVAINELDIWVTECFKSDKVFTILGI